MVCVCVLCFFFFKQKTAYEMRISDWSSDVCSSDGRQVPQECASLGKVGHGAEEGELPAVMEGAQPGEEQAAEQGTKDANREQEGGACGYPARSIAGDAAAGHDHVDMGMKIGRAHV